ncbi:MAG: hypothetical protein ACXADB_15225, partial [Candidatus Hermodarchaeia archaeon]
RTPRPHRRPHRQRNNGSLIRSGGFVMKRIHIGAIILIPLLIGALLGVIFLTPRAQLTPAIEVHANPFNPTGTLESPLDPNGYQHNFTVLGLTDAGVQHIKAYYDGVLIASWRKQIIEWNHAGNPSEVVVMINHLIDSGIHTMTIKG